MRLARLQLRNFRCFESLDLDLAQTTVLVGANDTGKSTILEAVRFLLGGDPGIGEGESLRRRGMSADQVVSVVGSFEDLIPEELTAYGPAAPGGVLRMGQSSRSSGLRLVMEASDLPALIAALDESRWKAAFGEGALVDGLFLDGPLGYVDDGLVWVDLVVQGLASAGHLSIFELFDYGQVVTTISLGGMHDTAWSAHAVLRPLIRRKLLSRVDPRFLDGLSMVNDSAADLLAEIDGKHSASLRRSSKYHGVRWRGNLEPWDVVDTLVEGILGEVLRDDSADKGSVTRIDSLSPGARRTLAIAALDLYRDPSLWALESEEGARTLAILLIEEPETGLHPAAQRTLARSLREWATYGLQLIVVTHSPAFVNAAEPAAVRLARVEPAADAEAGLVRSVVQPADLAEIRDSLGVEPADILLARRFVIVEGKSDQIILDIWARRLGIDLRAVGVQLVAGGGSSTADQIARFLNLAYEGADFVVVLDNGAATAKIKLENDQRFGSRVRTGLLSRTDIEGFFDAEAVVAWLRTNSVLDVDLVDRVAAAMANPGRIQGLNSLAEACLHRAYNKVDDGRMIANLTPERSIAPEIADLLHGLAAG